MTIDIMKTVEFSRRDHILKEAAGIIRTQGYAGASMRDIANAVGIEVSSLYNHIKSKHDILASICFSIGEEYIQGLDAILSNTLDCRQKIEAIISLHISLAAAHKDSMQVFEEEWKHLRDDDLSRFRSMRAYYKRQLLGFFAENIQAGHLRESSPEIALYTFLSSLKWLNFYFKDNKKKNADIIRHHLVQILCDGLIKETKRTIVS